MAAGGDWWQEGDDQHEDSKDMQMIDNRDTNWSPNKKAASSTILQPPASSSSSSVIMVGRDNKGYT